MPIKKQRDGNAPCECFTWARIRSLHHPNCKHYKAPPQEYIKVEQLAGAWASFGKEEKLRGAIAAMEALGHKGRNYQTS